MSVLFKIQCNNEQLTQKQCVFHIKKIVLKKPEYIYNTIADIDKVVIDKIYGPKEINII